MSQKKALWSLRKKEKFVNNKDAIFQEARSTDFVIAIMGPTGSGKSTFINTLLGKEEMKVTHKLESCTQVLQAAVIMPAGSDSTDDGRLIIVDTPGFDDTSLSDVEILDRISSWLATSYNCSMKLAGLIYLHDMTTTRMLGSSLKNLAVFTQLCGDKNMRVVTLMTTKWDRVVPAELASGREEELKDNHNRAWKVIEDIFARYARYRREDHTEDRIIQIQRELVDSSKKLPDTAAGKALEKKLKAELALLRRQAKASKTTGNAGQERIRAIEERIAKARRDMLALGAHSAPARFMAFLTRVSH
ncbi:P-loop containing nucleoside triphosphate hydrolase protein [Pholiota molesta]|nr:P-loop containing nucleoside triphosphate hydrolase protein [Pholiota molesta]